MAVCEPHILSVVYVLCVQRDARLRKASSAAVLQKKKISTAWFRSRDLWVMGPAR